MRLQKNTRFALCCLLDLAADPRRQAPVVDLARQFGISPHHLAKVLQRLTRAGLLESVRGVGGGYRFCGNARRLTLLDVIALFEDVGRAPAAAAVAGRRSARGRASRDIERALDTVLAEIDAIAQATFRSITLETMLKLASRSGAGRA